MNLYYAKPFRRLLAYWIDITLLYAVLVSLHFGLTALTDGALANWFVQRDNSFLTYSWIFLVISLPIWLYFILNESGRHQATLGKFMLGLKVTDMDGNRLKVATAAWRTTCKLAFFEIGHLSFLFPTPLFDEPVSGWVCHRHYPDARLFCRDTHYASPSKPPRFNHEYIGGAPVEV